MDVVKHNSAAWDKAVDEADTWTKPVSVETIERARRGDWTVLLTDSRPAPREWFGEIAGKDMLCLASGGGQQAPIFAAAGANVTSFDNSAKQLEQDRFVAERDGLRITLEKGDSADLSRFENDSFDFVFNPCSNLFMPTLQPIWDECFRVLRPRGTLLAGFAKPELFVFDQEEAERSGQLVPKYPLPYSDAASLTEEELQAKISRGEPLEYSHSLEEQIGGQTAAGFHIVGFYEDRFHTGRAINQFMPAFAATRAIKP